MIECGFFDSVNRDRPYRADQMCRPYELLVSNGVFATPEGTASNYLQVYEVSGMDVAVRPGRGIFKDKWLINDDDIMLTVEASEVTLTRIDSVIVRINTGESGDDARSGTILIKKGTPASSPIAPEMERSLDIHEYRLANIMVGPQVSEIAQKNISDQRGSADCPWVTSLIKQVDTSTLFEQWQDAYEKYYAKVEKEYLDYYASNEERFDAYYEEVNETFDDFYTSNSARFDTFYNNTNAKFNTLYSATEDRFDAYYTSNSDRFDTYYSENDKRFDDVMAEFQKSIAGQTLIRTYSSVYNTSAQTETVIPVNIEQYDNKLDVLQVFINGLIAIEGVDYTVDGNPATNITLTKGVVEGTQILFVIFKSIDGSAAETVVTQVANLEKKVAELEARIKALES